MRILSDDHLQEAASVIRDGGIVAHATETCYGLACDLTNADAVRKLFELKKRPEGMPVSALFASVEKAKEWVEWNEKAEELAGKYWPGPLTIVLKVESFRLKDVFPCPAPFNLQPSTLGIRISSHPIAQRLAELCGVPLSTTSANLHGQPDSYDRKEIKRQFSSEEMQPDLILDSGILPESLPSTVVLLKNGEVAILRQGAVRL